MLAEVFQRDLLRGSLDLMVLSTIAEEPQYGYSIQKRIADVSHEQVTLPAGTLYPLLHRLEEEKLIRSYWENSTGRKRKWYELTAAGKKTLTARANHWQEYAECVWRLIGQFSVKRTNPTSA